MEHIGTYAIEHELGGGTTGTVYLGRSRAGRAVAVKVARPELAQDPPARERFTAAVDAARAVGGFHTAPVLDAGGPGSDDGAGRETGALWFATAYVPGPALAGLRATGGSLDENELRRLGTGMADALQSVHRCGLVHGALKPENVLLSEDGPRIRDFGFAGVLGSGRPATVADDVYALGSVLVSACGGDVAQLPEPLRETVTACLDSDPERRPDTAALLDAFLRRPAPVHTSAAQAPPPVPPPAPAAAPASGPYAPPPGPAQAQPPVQAPGSFGPAPPVPGPPAAPADPAAPTEETEFLAMDRRNDIVADAHGISFSVRGHSTDLVWPHIRYAQYQKDAQGSGFGLTLSLVLVNGAQFACRVSTRNMWEVEQWAGQLDTVLARYLPRPS